MVSDLSVLPVLFFPLDILDPKKSPWNHLKLNYFLYVKTYNFLQSCLEQNSFR